MRRGAQLGTGGALTLVALLALSAIAAAASPPPKSEYELKAAFLYNFAKFIDWPPRSFERPDAPMVFCVLGDDPFGPILAGIAREDQVMSRQIALRRADQPDQLGGCHVVFVRPAAEVHLPELLRQAAARHVLLVGESSGFAERGGGIGLFVEQNRVRFAVNVAAIERAGLKVSSKLLKVARVIRV